MIQVSTIQDIRDARKKLKGRVGLVPTMGYLHAGHISLVEIAKEHSDIVIMSIFVNPSQFGPNDDLEAYPRNLEHDFELLEQAGVDLVWLPTNEIMYPKNYQTWIDLDHIPQFLEGRQRPGHFKGVSTVVAKLINVVQPDLAVFGQKDAQQVAVIKQMVRDLNMPVEIAVGAIIREPDGLAMSSRNSYLDVKHRQAATVLYQALQDAQTKFQKGERRAEAIRKTMTDTINNEPLAKLEYVSCANLDSLEELENISTQALLSMAVYVGQTRLIDNLVLGEE
jgi:pantoate--beta-alanine ligase